MLLLLPSWSLPKLYLLRCALYKHRTYEHYDNRDLLSQRNMKPQELGVMVWIGCVGCSVRRLHLYKLQNDVELNCKVVSISTAMADTIG